ncbi:DUF2059 domain-containing protein [Variovorax sp. KBS0712]|uniref:DUF2059 domain-containing protein n=1 Tax=Variovorax sp. KBS0712 TaxID=2578111 RepID=UPI0011194FFC|nr:DUF2059 domain-containing protein [Variovorax sp. KBS0712]TSD61409.1 DUF2059 domain-containing protein [Variovorax sp. KBS0712]
MKVRIRGRFAIAATLTAMVAAHAQPSPSSVSSTDSKKQLAAQFFDAARLGVMYEELLARCTEEGPQSFATQAYTVDPRSFGSLTPKSSYWPDVEAAHRRYRVTVCSYSTGAEFKAFYIEHFLPDLSEADLRVAIAFYSSPSGQLVAASSEKFSRAFYPVASQQMLAAAQAATAALQKDMKRIYDAYKLDPK